MLCRLSSGITFFAIVAAAGVASAQPNVTPSPELEKLTKKMVGTWDVVIQAGPGADTKGVSVSRMDLGGLWMISDFEGDFGGMPFKGMGIDGYDPAKKKFVGVWLDSMSTSPMFIEGEMDASGKKLTQVGRGAAPDGTETEMKMVTEFIDDDHHTFTMYMVGPNGAEAEMMTLKYSRRKS